METNAYLMFKRARVQLVIDDYNYSEVTDSLKMQDVMNRASPYYEMVSGFSFENVADVLRKLGVTNKSYPENYKLSNIEYSPSLVDCLMYEASLVISNSASTFNEGGTFYFEGPWYILKEEDKYTLHYTIEDSY